MSTGLATNGVPGAGANGTPARRAFPAGPQQIKRVDPRTETVAAGGWGASYGLKALERVPTYQEAFRVWGPQLYDRMLNDPAVHAGLETLKMSAVGAGLTLAAAIAIDVTDEEPTAEQEADADRAAEIRDECQWMIERMARPIDGVLHEMLDALAYGVKLAEIVWEDAVTDDGRKVLAVRELAIKPRESWRFWVDPFFGVVAIEATAVGPDGTPGVAHLPPEKFLWLTWWPKDGDPRGRTVLSAAYLAWLDKQQVLPDRFNFLFRFGQPRIIVTEGAAETLVMDAEGKQHYVGPMNDAALDALYAGSWARLIGIENIEVIPAAGDVDAHNGAIDADNREIMLSILQNTRTILEAQNGSKADSETAKDVTDLVVRAVQRPVVAMLEELLWRYVLANHGREAADRYTPDVVFAAADQADLAALLTAASAWASKYPATEAQLRAMDERLGLPAAPWGARPGGMVAKTTTVPSVNPPGQGNSVDGQQGGGQEKGGSNEDTEDERDTA